VSSPKLYAIPHPDPECRCVCISDQPPNGDGRDDYGGANICTFWGDEAADRAAQYVAMMNAPLDAPAKRLPRSRALLALDLAIRARDAMTAEVERLRDQVERLADMLDHAEDERHELVRALNESGQEVGLTIDGDIVPVTP
jgi:hypothetical protein